MTIKELSRFINIYIDTSQINKPVNKYYIYITDIYTSSTSMDDKQIYNMLRNKITKVITDLLEYKFITSFEIDISTSGTKVSGYLRGNININDFIKELNK